MREVMRDSVKPGREKKRGSHVKLSDVAKRVGVSPITISRALRNPDIVSEELREVILRGGRSGKPVEFGAIRINLQHFDPEPRRRILEESGPLGQILADCRVKYSSRPKTFLKIVADDFIAGVLGAAPGTLLYARRNTLSDPRHHPLAEIVEILPP